MIPAGPWRYSYAAVVELLRRAGLFHDPQADTATDPVLRREALVDLLIDLLARGVRVGLVRADRLDHASARLLRAFADTARLAVEHGHDASGLVIGAAGGLAPELQLESADIREVAADARPYPQLPAEARETLALLAAAPHPVAESELAGASPLSLTQLRAALRQLAAAELVELGPRVALGPAADVSADPGLARRWLETSELRLPQARLAVSNEPDLAKHLAREALSSGEADVAAHYFSLAGPLDARGELAYAEALALAGHGNQANELFQRHKADGPVLEAGKVAELLAARGLITDEEAEAFLRRAEREGQAVATRPQRARLLLRRGEDGTAHNLLRRTTRAELESASPAVRLEHLLAQVRASGTARKLDEAAALCSTRAERRRVAELAGDEALQARLAAKDLDAAALRRMPHDVVQDALHDLLSQRGVAGRAAGETPAALFERLREHGATLLAALVGDELVLHPPGAAARPGLAVRMKTKLDRLRAHPQAVSFGRDEFSSLGPFSGQSALAMQSFGKAGPVLVLFRAPNLPDVSHLL